MTQLRQLRGFRLEPTRSKLAGCRSERSPSGGTEDGRSIEGHDETLESPDSAYGTLQYVEIIESHGKRKSQTKRKKNELNVPTNYRSIETRETVILERCQRFAG